jgi:hypothetical protein
LGERFGGRQDVEKGFIYRFLGEFEFTPQEWYEAPLLGHGLGVGTNVGTMLLFGNRTGFSLGENEWDHVMSECGPIEGFLVLSFRLALVVSLLSWSTRAARSGNVLPFLLLGACWVAICNGIWAQATSLGFAMFGGGLCGAAISPASIPRSNQPNSRTNEP